MYWFFQRQQICVKFISITIIFSFLSAESVQAQNLSQFSTPQSIPLPGQSLIVNSLAHFELPPELGQLKQVYQASDSAEDKAQPYIVHIQDSHANYQAQQNIDKILNRLYENGFNGSADDVLICLEGAAGELDPSLFRALENEKTRKLISNSYLQEGKLTAAEFFAINHSAKLSLYGIETPSLYLKNIQFHHHVREKRQESQQYFQSRLNENQAAKEMVFPDFFLTFDQQTEKLHQNEMSLPNYIDWISLEVAVNWKKYSHLKELADALTLQESIRPKGVARERDLLIEKLKARLVKEDLASLVKLSLEYRLGKIESLEFHSRLLNMASLYQVKGRYVELEKLIQFLEKQKVIKTENALAELDQLYQEVEETYLTTEEQKQIQQEAEWLKLARSMSQLEVTREQLQAYTQQKEKILKFIHDHSLQQVLDSAEHFYKIAQKRDVAIVQNTLQALKDQNKKIAVLITGGFHTEGLMQELKQVDTSHIVISPRLTEEMDADLYDSLMSPQLSSFQRYLLNAGNRLAAPLYLFSNVIIGNNSEIREQMRQADTLRFILEYLGYRAFELQEKGRSAEQIEIALQIEMEEVARSLKTRLPSKERRYWEGYFKKIAAQKFPRGLLLGSNAEVPTEQRIALLVATGKQAFKKAIARRTIKGVKLVYGNEKDLKEEARVAVSLSQLKWEAKQRQRADAAKERQARFAEQTEAEKVAAQKAEEQRLRQEEREALAQKVAQLKEEKARKAEEAKAAEARQQETQKYTQFVEERTQAVEAKKQPKKKPQDVAQKVATQKEPVAVEQSKKKTIPKLNSVKVRFQQPEALDWNEQAEQVGEQLPSLGEMARFDVGITDDSLKEAAFYLGRIDWDAINLGLMDKGTGQAEEEFNALVGEVNEVRQELVAATVEPMPQMPRMSLLNNSVVKLLSILAFMPMFMGANITAPLVGVVWYVSIFGAGVIQYAFSFFDWVQGKKAALLGSKRGQAAARATALHRKIYGLNLKVFQNIELLQTDNFLKTYNVAVQDKKLDDLETLITLVELVDLGELERALTSYPFFNISNPFEATTDDGDSLGTIPPYEAYSDLIRLAEDTWEFQQSTSLSKEEIQEKVQQGVVKIKAQLHKIKLLYEVNQVMLDNFNAGKESTDKKIDAFFDTLLYEGNGAFEGVFSFWQTHITKQLNVAHPEIEAIQNHYDKLYQELVPFLKQLIKAKTPAKLINNYLSNYLSQPIKVNEQKSIPANQALHPQFFVFAVSQLAQQLGKEAPKIRKKVEAFQKETIASAIADYPFWGMEIPYVPEEPELKIKLISGTEGGVEMLDSGVLYRKSTLYVDIDRVDLAELKKEIVEVASRYLTKKSEKAESLEKKVVDIFKSYERGYALGNKIKQNKAKSDLEKLFQSEENQVYLPFLKSLVSREFQKKQYGFIRSVKEYFTGIVKGRITGGLLGRFRYFGRHSRMMATAAFAIVMIGSFATMVMAQEPPAPDQPQAGGPGQQGQGPQAGQPAGQGPQVQPAVLPQNAPAIVPPTQQEIDAIYAQQLSNIEAMRTSLQGLIATERAKINFAREAMLASARMETIYNAVNTQYFGVLVDRSEAQFTLDANTQLPVPTMTHGTIATRYNPTNRTYEPMVFSGYLEYLDWVSQNFDSVQIKGRDGVALENMLEVGRAEDRGESITTTFVSQTNNTTIYRFNTTTNQYERVVFLSEGDFQNWVQANISLIGAYDEDGFRSLFPDANTILSRVNSGEQMTLVIDEPGSLPFANMIRPDLAQRNIVLEFEFGVKARQDRAAYAQDGVTSLQRAIALQAELSRIAHRFVRRAVGYRFAAPEYITLPNGQRISNRFQETVDFLQQIPRDQLIFRRIPEGQRPGVFVAGERIHEFDLDHMTRNNIPYQIWIRDAALNEELYLGSGVYAARAKFTNSQAYQAERTVEFIVREILSRGVPAGVTLAQLQEAVRTGNIDNLSARYQTSHRYFALAELTMTNGRPSGLANLHDEGALAHAVEQLAALDRRGTPMYRPQVNEYGFPTVRLPLLNAQGEMQMTTIVQNGERIEVPQQQLVGFFIRNGSRWQRLKSDQIDGAKGRYVMRVINSETQANGSDTFYNEADLGNQLIFGRNVLRTRLVENRVGAFRNLVEIMDAEKNLNNLYGELVVSTVGAIFNVTLFVDPTGSGALINRAIPTGVRAAYQVFVQSQNLPTALPVINVDKQKNETLAEADARIRQEARRVLDNLNKTRGGGLITGLPDRILSTINLSMSSSDAQQLHEFIYAMAATVYSKEFNGYDSDNNPITTVTPEELDMVVVTLFHTDWHKHREVTSRIDFFTSLMVNMVLLSNTADESSFSLVRLEPDGAGGFNGVHARDTTHFSQLIQKFFVGDIGGSSVMPSPTTAGYVNLTSFARVFREVSSTKGVMESWPLPLGAGPSMASIIKTLSAGYFYEDSTYVWEPESLVFTLFGFPLQIFGSIRDNQNYIEGLRNYGVMARTESSQGWFERLGRTFIGGRALPITSLQQHQELDRRKVLLGYAQVPLPNQGNASQVTSTRVPVYGIMGDEGIEFIWVPGAKALEENLHQIQRDIEDYDQYHRLMGREGGAILNVSPGRYYNFTSANSRFSHIDLAAFLRATRNGANQLTPSFWFSPQHAGQGTQQWQHWTATYDQAIRSMFFHSVNDRSMGNQIADSLYGLRGGLKRNEQTNDQTSIPLYPSAINVSNGRIAEGNIHAGPNAFMGLTYMHSLFSHNPYLMRSYQNAYHNGSNRTSLLGYIFSGDINNYEDYLGPDWFNDLEDIDDSRGNTLFDAPSGNLDDNIQNQNAQNALAEMRLISDGLISRMETEDVTWRGVIWQDKANGISSVEEMMAAYRLFMNMNAITQEDKYYNAGISVLRFLSRHMWNNDDGYFYVGTHKERGRIVVNQTYVTDVQAISILSLGPEVLEDFKDPDTGRRFFGDGYVGARILRRLINRDQGSLVSVQQNGQTILGFDTTNRAGRLAIGRIEGTNQERPQAVFVEQSSYVALAMQTYADYLENVMGSNHEDNPLSNADRAKARNDWAPYWRGWSTAIVNTLKHLGVRSSAGGVGMPVSTGDNVRLYPFRDYRAPRNVAAAVAPTVLYGMALRSYNPYQLDGHFWYGQRETSGNASTLYSGLPQATQAVPNWSTQTTDIVVGTGEARSLTPGRSLFFINEGTNQPSADLESLLRALIKVRSWNQMSPADQALPRNQHLRPTADDLDRTQGKSFLHYDQSTNTFSYEEGGQVYTWTLIASYEQIQQGTQQYQAQLQRAQLETQIAQRGAIQFTNEAGQTLDIRGNAIGEGSTAMPHVILGRGLIPDPNDSSKQIVDMSQPNAILNFLAAQFARVDTNGQPIFSAHQQYQILARGWFDADVDYIQEDGSTVRTVRTRLVIREGLSGALENLQRERGTDEAFAQTLQRIRDIQRMPSISGVIQTNRTGGELQLHVGIQNQGQSNEVNVGQVKVEEVLAWLRVHPERMAEAYRNRFANIEYEQPDGQTVMVTLVFGEGMAQNYMDQLQERLTQLEQFERELALTAANLRRGPPFVNPERMNRYLNPRVDPRTGDVTLDVANLFNPSSVTQEVHRNNVVIQVLDPSKNLRIVNHPELGVEQTFYVQATDNRGRTLTVASSLDRNGEIVYTQQDHVLETSFRINSNTTLTLDWQTGAAVQEVRYPEGTTLQVNGVSVDVGGEVQFRIHGTFNRDNVRETQRLDYSRPAVRAALEVRFNEREEVQYGTTSLNVTLNGTQQTLVRPYRLGSETKININPETGELQANSVVDRTARLVTDRDLLFRWGIPFNASNPDENWDVLKQQGWSAVEMTSTTGGKTLQVFNALGHLMREHSARQITLYTFNRDLNVSQPLVEIDRTGRQGNTVVINGTTYNNVVVHFTQTQRDSTGNLVSTGTHYSGQAVTVTRDNLNHLISIQQGDERTEYRYENGREIPVRTINVNSNEVLVEFAYAFDAAAHEVRVTRYDRRNNSAKVEVYNTQQDRLVRILEGRYQTVRGTITYETRSDIGYDAQGRETQRDLYVGVNPDGTGGRHFERSTFKEINSNGETVFTVVNQLTQRTFERATDRAGHLAWEADAYTKLIYRYNAEQRVSYPELEIDLTGQRPGVNRVVNGETVHVMNTFNVTRVGNEYRIEKILAVNPNNKTIEVRNLQMRLLSIEYPNDNIIHFDGTLLETPLYRTNRVGITLQLIEENGVRRLPNFQTSSISLGRDPHNNVDVTGQSINVVNGVLQQTETGTVQATAVAALFDVRYLPEGGSVLTEYEMQSSIHRGKPAVITYRDSLGRVTRMYKINYRVLPDQNGAYSVLATQTIVNQFENNQNPMEATYTRVFSDNPAFASQQGTVALVVDPEFLTQHPELNGLFKMDELASQAQGERRLLYQYQEHIPQLLIYDAKTSIDTPTIERSRDYEVRHRNGHRVFRLHNTGKTEFVGGRPITRIPFVQNLINRFQSNSGFAWFKMNLGMTYSTVLPLKPPDDITPYNISEFDYLTFYIKGQIGGENYRITFTDQTGDVNRTTFTWTPQGTAADVTTGWQKVSVPLSQVVGTDGQRITDLIQIGVQYGNDVGNAPGTQIYISNFTFENSDGSLRRSALGVSGEILGSGDYEVVPPSKTDGNSVPNFTATNEILGQENLRPEDRSFQGKFSYLLNSEGAILGTTDLIFEDSQGNQTFRIWRLEGEQHVIYDETRTARGQVIDRVFLFREMQDNYLHSWRERIYYDSLGFPKFSVYEQNDPQLGRKAGQLRRLYQAQRDAQGNLTIWEHDVEKNETHIWFVTPDGERTELFNRPLPMSWEAYQAQDQHQIDDLANNWDDKYKRFDESVSPKEVYRYKTWFALFTGFLSALFGALMASVSSEGDVEKALRIEKQKETVPVVEAKTIDKDKRKELLKQMRDWAGALGFDDTEIEKLKPFFVEDVLVRLKYTGDDNLETVRIERLYKDNLIEDNDISKALANYSQADSRISLKKYVVYGLLRRHLWQFGPTQLTEFLADWLVDYLDETPRPKEIRGKLNAYRDVVYTIAHTHSKFKKKDTQGGKPSLLRKDLLMFEDVSATFRYIREGEIDAAALRLDPDQILELHKYLNASYFSVNPEKLAGVDEKTIKVHSYVVNEVQEALAKADEKRGISRRAPTLVSGLWRTANYLLDWFPGLNWINHLVSSLKSYNATLVSLEKRTAKIGTKEFTLNEPVVIRLLGGAVGMGGFVSAFVAGLNPVQSAIIAVVFYSLVNLTYRFYRSQKLAVRQEKDVASAGAFFWSTTIGIWAAWNIYIGQVWLRGVAPYWDSLFAAGIQAKMSGVILLGTSFLAAFFFMILSFYAVAWLIGSLTSMGYLESNRQARIKADKPFRLWHLAAVVTVVVAAWVVLEILFFGTGFQLGFAWKPFLLGLGKKFGWISLFLGAPLALNQLAKLLGHGLNYIGWPTDQSRRVFRWLTVFRDLAASPAGALKELPQLFIDQYQEDPVRLKKITWEFRDLIEDMYDSYKIDATERQNLLSSLQLIGASFKDLNKEELEALGQTLESLKIKEARDRIKFWANNLLRNDPFEENPPWDQLVSHTQMIPTIDDFRRDWDVLFYIDSTTGMNRMHRLLAQGTYGEEFDIFLKRMDQKAADKGFDAEDRESLKAYVAKMEQFQANGLGVSVARFEGKIGKWFMREVEDWANDRLQMVETAFKGFLRVRNGYYEQALKKIALDRGIEANDMTIDEIKQALLVSEKVDVSGVAYFQLDEKLAQTDISELANQLTDEKYQILWGYGGPWVRDGFNRFKNPPKGKSHNRPEDWKDIKGWDLVQEMWDAVESELKDMKVSESVQDQVNKIWLDNGLLQPISWRAIQNYFLKEKVDVLKEALKQDSRYKTEDKPEVAFMIEIREAWKGQNYRADRLLDIFKVELEKLNLELGQESEFIEKVEEIINNSPKDEFITGPLFEESEIQAEAVEFVVRKAWEETLELLDPSKVADFKRYVSASYLGYAVAYGLNFAALSNKVSTGAGSPKADNQAHAFAYVRGDTVSFYDGDTEIRKEDARKLVQMFKRFGDNPKLGVVQVAQYTFNEAYGRQNELSVEAIGSFWHALLRLKSKVGSVGFYGHNGVFRTQFLLDFDGMQPDHISEDILAYWILRSYGAEGGYEDRLQLGEGQETTQTQYAGPTSKWSQGASRNELQGSRSADAYFKAKHVSFAEKFDSRYNLDFYDNVHFYAVAAIIIFVFGPLIYGANPFAVLPGSYMVLGWLMSQALGTFSLIQFWHREGYFKGTFSWLSFLFLRGGFFFWTVMLSTQADALRKGMAEKGKWFTASKDQGVLSEKWSNLFSAFSLGFMVAVPLLSMMVYAPLDPMILLTIPIVGLFYALWVMTGRSEKMHKLFMASMWIAPVMLGMAFFATGGGSAISGLFYLYVVVSWVVSPFIFNPNILGTKLDYYAAVSHVENVDSGEKFKKYPFKGNRRQAGYLLSLEKGKVERIEELLANTTLVESLRKREAVKPLLSKLLTQNKTIQLLSAEEVESFEDALMGLSLESQINGLDALLEPIHQFIEKYKLVLSLAQPLFEDGVEKLEEEALTELQERVIASIQEQVGLSIKQDALYQLTDLKEFETLIVSIEKVLNDENKAESQLDSLLYKKEKENAASIAGYLSEMVGFLDKEFWGAPLDQVTLLKESTEDGKRIAPILELPLYKRAWMHITGSIGDAFIGSQPKPVFNMVYRTKKFNAGAEYDVSFVWKTLFALSKVFVVAVYEIATFWATLAAWGAAISSRVLASTLPQKRTEAIVNVLNIIVFVVQGVRSEFRSRINAFGSDWQEEVLYDKTKMYLDQFIDKTAQLPVVQQTETTSETPVQEDEQQEEVVEEQPTGVDESETEEVSTQALEEVAADAGQATLDTEVSAETEAESLLEGEIDPAASGAVTLEGLEEIVAGLEQADQAPAANPYAGLGAEMDASLELAATLYPEQPAEVEVADQEVVTDESAVGDTKANEGIENALKLLEDELPDEEDAFVLRRAVQFDRAIQKAYLDNSVHIVFQGTDELVLQKRGTAQKEPWTEMFDQAIRLLVQRLKADETLNPYWTELLSREDNRAPPALVLDLSADLDDKTASIRKAHRQEGRVVQVDLLFSQKFIQSLAKLYSENQEAVAWVLAERLFHELGHTNAEKTAEERFNEETSLIQRDLQFNQLTRQIQIGNQSLQKVISELIQNNQLGELFPGFFFNFLGGLSALNLSEEEQVVAIRNFARSSLHVGETIADLSGEEVALTAKEPLVAEQADAAKAVLNKILQKALADQAEAQQVLDQVNLPVEAGETKESVVQQILTDASKEALVVGVVEALITTEALTAELFEQITRDSAEIAETAELAYVTNVQQQYQEVLKRDAAVLERTETLLRENAEKKDSELILIDSSFLKTLRSDQAVMDLLKQYRSTVAIMVMEEQETESFVRQLEQEGFVITYERESFGGSLERGALNQINAQNPKAAFSEVLVVTVDQSSHKWQWLDSFNYRVFINKGDSEWAAWMASSTLREALNQARETMGLSWEEVIRTKAPEVGGKEVAISENIVLISA